jgi:hypothetical protein
MTLWCVQGQIYLYFIIIFTESSVWGIKYVSSYALLSVCCIMREVSSRCGPRYLQAVITDVSGMFRAVAAGLTARSRRFEGSSWVEW